MVSPNRPVSALSIALLAGCSGTLSSPVADAAVAADAGAPPADAGAPPADASPARTFLLTLDAGAFPPTPAHPSALVYLPAAFDPTPPLAVVVFLHGFSNCVENVVREAGQSCDPAAGTPVRTAFALAAQLEASGRNALLLCPEVVFDRATGAPGNLGAKDGFRALLDEALRDLAPALGPVTVADVGTVVVASHSGGYQAAAAIAARGGVPVAELYLLDSLYGDTVAFDDWVKRDLAAFVGPHPARRFADVYTSGGGTLANSVAMAGRAAGWFPPDAGAIVDDRTTGTWPDETYHHGLLFKLSGLGHSEVPRHYFGTLVATSSLPPRP